MTRSTQLPTPRRSFLQRLAAGTAAFAAGWPAVAHAATNAPAGVAAPDDAWVAKIHGKYKQVFDGVNPSDGNAVLFGLNFLDSTTQALGIGPNDITAVIVLRHWAMPLALKDDVWAKYKIGEAIKVQDPKTSAPAARNVFRDNILLRPGLTYDTVLADKRVVVVACNMALTVLAEMLGKGVGIPADQAKAEWNAGLLPGVFVAPSGVYAVNRAQQAGCTYCYAG
jgi:hypothetical protein